MPRETKAAKKERALEIEKRMNEHYPEALTALDYEGDPFKLTIAVLLSAQTTDKAVNLVTPELWRRYPEPQDLANANIEDVEAIIHRTGFYHTKAAHCIACAQMVVSEFDGEVPQTMKELQMLPGVGRKTANIVLNEGFGIVEGIAVDTHIFRVTHRLQLSRAKTPAETEQDLLKLYPQELWRYINRQWVLFGREICTARNPHCIECFLHDLCPYAQK
ncbi:MAG: endonuclease III [Eggerthellaceae bacterium]|jgi:endonuclease-3